MVLKVPLAATSHTPSGNILAATPLATRSAALNPPLAAAQCGGSSAAKPPVHTTPMTVQLKPPSSAQVPARKAKYVLKWTGNVHARQEELVKVTQVECNGCELNGLHLHHKKANLLLQKQSSDAGHAVWLGWFECAFCKDVGKGNDKVAGCKWKMKELVHRPVGREEWYEWFIIPSLQHTTHEMARVSSSASLSITYKAHLTSSMSHLQSNVAVDQMEQSSHYDINEGRKKTARRFFGRQKHMLVQKATGLSFAARSTWGGLHQVIDTLLGPAVMERPDFDEHSCFVCGTPVVDPGTEKTKPRLVVVYSSVNLLLNAARHRWTQWARPCQFSVDTTYRLVNEGHGLLVVGVMGLDQHLHHIGYACVTSEDTIGHLEVFRMLAQEVGTISNEAIAAGALDETFRV